MSLWKLSKDCLTTDDYYIGLICDTACGTDYVLKLVALHIP